MSFDESQVVRDQSGKFDEKIGAKPDVELKATPGDLVHDPDYTHKPGVYGGYEIKNYRDLRMGREGGAFMASIYRDGKRVMLAENTGNGGANTYTDLTNPKSPSRYYGPEITRYEAFATKALDANPAFPENSDSWLAFHQWAADIDKTAVKNGWSREAAIEGNLKAALDLPEYAQPSEREQAILRDPSIISKLSL